MPNEKLIFYNIVTFKSVIAKANLCDDCFKNIASLFREAAPDSSLLKKWIKNFNDNIFILSSFTCVFAKCACKHLPNKN